MSATTSPSDRQFGIWRSRIYREFDKCAQLYEVCPGATLHELCVDEPQGVAVARFHVYVPFREGSSALRMVPLTALEVSMRFDQARSVRGVVQFPFCAPRVRIYEGAEYLPREMRRVSKTTGDTLLLLQTLAHWSPSNTLVMILQDFVAAVQESDPHTSVATSDVAGSSGNGSSYAEGSRGGKRLRMRKRDIYGAVYHCQEVDSRTGTLRPVPMLLQSGNVVLLVPPSKADKRNAQASDERDHIYVSDLFPLKDIARITPQRGKSVTFFFKNQRMHCRTLLTAQTDAIVADIQRMIAAVGSNKRARDDDLHNRRSDRRQQTHASNAQDDGTFSQLLSFLTPEQSEKAKEVSNKIVGKLSRWGTSVSRFFKGEDIDESDHGPSRAPRDPALNDIDRLKNQFFRYPSKNRMLEITNRYQQVAESLAQRNNRDGQVEKTIEEMQAFIEHPTTQKLLLEAYAVDNAGRGIRVGSL